MPTFNYTVYTGDVPPNTPIYWKIENRAPGAGDPNDAVTGTGSLDFVATSGQFNASSYEEILEITTNVRDDNQGVRCYKIVVSLDSGYTNPKTLDIRVGDGAQTVSSSANFTGHTSFNTASDPLNPNTTSVASSIIRARIKAVQTIDAGKKTITFYGYTTSSGTGTEVGALDSHPTNSIGTNDVVLGSITEPTGVTWNTKWWNSVVTNQTPANHSSNTTPTPSIVIGNGTPSGSRTGYDITPTQPQSGPPGATNLSGVAGQIWDFYAYYGANLTTNYTKAGMAYDETVSINFFFGDGANVTTKSIALRLFCNDIYVDPGDPPVEPDPTPNLESSFTAEDNQEDTSLNSGPDATAGIIIKLDGTLQLDGTDCLFGAIAQNDPSVNYLWWPNADGYPVSSYSVRYNTNVFPYGTGGGNVIGGPGNSPPNQWLALTSVIRFRVATTTTGPNPLAAVGAFEFSVDGGATVVGSCPLTLSAKRLEYTEPASPPADEPDDPVTPGNTVDLN